MTNNSSCIEDTYLEISHSLQTNQVECDIDSIISGTLSNAENAPQALLEIILSQQEADGSHKHSGKELHEVLRIKETSNIDNNGDSSPVVLQHSTESNVDDLPSRNICFYSLCGHNNNNILMVCLI